MKRCFIFFLLMIGSNSALAMRYIHRVSGALSGTFSSVAQLPKKILAWPYKTEASAAAVLTGLGSLCAYDVINAIRFNYALKAELSKVFKPGSELFPPKTIEQAAAENWAKRMEEAKQREEKDWRRKK